MIKTKAIMLLFVTVILCSCDNEQLSEEQSIQNDAMAIETVKSNLMHLNVSYMPKPSNQKRMPKWLRWLIFGAADTAGAIFAGVPGACSASSLAWTVTKPEMATSSSNSGTTTQNAPALKTDNLQGLTAGSIGYTHNVVIENAFTQNENLYVLNNEEVLSIVFNALENETGKTLSNAEKSKIIDCTNTIINSFDTEKSVGEYFDDLILQTVDQQKKEALDVCKIILEGLQYVDDSDTSYVEAATEIISNSNLCNELKTTINDGLSVANASAKLWNTGEIVSIPAKE